METSLLAELRVVRSNPARVNGGRFSIVKNGDWFYVFFETVF
jgi:hypothetical protein